MQRVCVPGLGVAGMLCAFELRKRGLDVVVHAVQDTSLVKQTHTGAWQWGCSEGHLAHSVWSVREHVEWVHHVREGHPYGMYPLEPLYGILSWGYGVLKQMHAVYGVQMPTLAWDEPCGVRLACDGLYVWEGVQQGCAVPSLGRVGVLQLQDDGFWDAAHAVEGWKSLGVCPQADWEVLDIPMGEGLHPMGMACWLDTAGVAEALAQHMLPHALGLDVLVVPPYMGVQRWHHTVRVLQEVCGVQVCEAVSLTWPLAHMRLQHVLMQAWVMQGGECVQEAEGDQVAWPCWDGLYTSDSVDGVAFLSAYEGVCSVLKQRGLPW
jgi:hypothetical protein